MIVGQSAVMQDLRIQVGRVAATTFTVLVEGESGAGKELVARDIHARSARCRGPFVAVNCAAIVETLVEAELFGIEERTATGVRGRRGKFELAEGGTLFLDEVGDLSPAAQAKLLRVLQDSTVERVGAHGSRSIDTRIVAATNRSLHTMVSTGGFRPDLYYRLAGVEIMVPPLRDRREDIPLLTKHLLSTYGRGLAIGTAALEALVAFDWPGNVRQLARVVERAIALTDRAGDHAGRPPRTREKRLQEPAPDIGDRGDSLRAWSSRYVRLVLERCRGNKRRACDVLDISYHTLQAHLAYGRRDGSSHPSVPSDTCALPQQAS